MDREKQLKEEIKKITKGNEKAIKEGRKILSLLPKLTYSWFSNADMEDLPEERWKGLLDKDWKNIKKYSDGKYNIVKYIISSSGDRFIEIRNEKNLIYFPSEMYIRLAGACWSEKVWLRCFKGQQEFIRNHMYINSRCYFENIENKDKTIYLDMTRMNVLYSGYLKHNIYDNEVFAKEESDFTIYQSGIDLEKVQKQYFDIISWIKDEDNENWVNFYNNGRGKLLLTVLHMLDVVYDAKYDFSPEYHKEPITEANFFDLQNHDKYDYHNFDLKFFTKTPEDEPLFKKPFHNAEECYNVFKEIQNKYYILDAIVHNLPSYLKERLERAKNG